MPVQPVDYRILLNRQAPDIMGSVNRGLQGAHNVNAILQQRKAKQDQEAVKQILSSESDPEKAFQMITPIIGPERAAALKDKYTETSLKNATIKKYYADTEKDLQEIYSTQAARTANVLKTLDGIQDPKEKAYAYYGFRQLVEKAPSLYGLDIGEVPQIYDANWVNQTIAAGEQIGKGGKTAISPTALLMQSDTPENRQIVENQLIELEKDPAMDKQMISTIRATNQIAGQGAPAAAKMLNEYMLRVKAPVQTAKEKMPIEIQTEVGKESGKAPIKIATATAIEKGKADVKIETKKQEQAIEEATKQSSNLSDADNLLTAVTQIEQNPTILESLPSGWANLGGNLSRFLPVENAGIYAANLQRIGNIMALFARSKLKGQGQVSDMETGMVKDAATNIKEGTPKQRRVELARIKDLAVNLKYRIENGIYNKGGKWYKEEDGKEVQLESGDAPAEYKSQFNVGGATVEADTTAIEDFFKARK